MKTKQIIFILLFILTITAFLLRVLPFGYGKAHIYFPDTGLFINALKLANGIADYDFSQFKEPGDYPFFFSYIFLFFFGIFYLIGIITGIFSSANGFFKYAVLEADQLFEISRIVVAVCGTLLIPLVYLSIKRILLDFKKKWAEAGAVLSACLMCFSVLHIHYSHLIRSHLPLAFILFLGFYFYLLLLKKQNLIFYILLGLTTGLALGTLHGGILAFFLLLMAHFFILKQQNLKFDLKNIFSVPFIAGLIAFVLTVCICWPYLVLNPKATLTSDSGKFDFTLSGQSHYLGGTFDGQGWINNSKGLIFNETSLIALLILLIICFVFLRKKEQNKELTQNFYYKTGIKGGLFILISYFAIFGGYNVPSFKFLIPLVPFLCLFAGILFSQILRLISKKYRVYLSVFVVIILVFSMVQSIRLTTLITKKDTRDLAAVWIEKNIDSSKMIAISSTGPKLFPSQESLKQKLLLTGPDSLGHRDKLLLSFPKEEYPKNGRLIFPLWAFDENYTEVYNFLKNQSDYFIFVNHSLQPGIDPLRDMEEQMAVQLGTLVKTFNPFKKLSNRESVFPVHIYNPLIDLWALNRMGPVIKIYKLNK